jgi:hypothetical protein
MSSNWAAQLDFVADLRELIEGETSPSSQRNVLTRPERNRLRKLEEEALDARREFLDAPDGPNPPMHRRSIVRVALFAPGVAACRSSFLDVRGRWH